MSIDIYKIIKRPIITEKTTQLKQNGIYVFEVNRESTKTEIKFAIEKLFNVDVVDVRTSIVKGKLKRFGRYEGYRPDWKKAVVKIKSGQTIKAVDELQ